MIWIVLLNWNWIELGIPCGKQKERNGWLQRFDPHMWRILGNRDGDSVINETSRLSSFFTLNCAWWIASGCQNQLKERNFNYSIFFLFFFFFFLFFFCWFCFFFVGQGSWFPADFEDIHWTGRGHFKGQFPFLFSFHFFSFALISFLLNTLSYVWGTGYLKPWKGDWGRGVECSDSPGGYSEGFLRVLADFG